MPGLPHFLPSTLGPQSFLAITVTPNSSLAYFEIDITGLSGFSTMTLTRLNTVTGAVDHVRSANQVATGGADVLAFFDYEAPLNVSVIYTVTTNNGAQSSAPASTIVVPDGVYWLKNVSQEGLSTMVLVSTLTVKRSARILSTNKVLGRQNPVLITDVRGGREGAMTLLSVTTSGNDSVNAVTAPGDTLFFQAPSSTNFPDMYFIAGDIEEVWTGAASEPTHTFSFPYTEVDSPSTSLSSLGFNTYLQVTTFASYTNLIAKRATYLNVLNTPWTLADS